MADIYNIAILGSGPAGISAAAHAATLGLSHILLEKTDHLSDTIYKYQKGKHIMATPDQLVLRSDIGFEAGKREDILERWNTQSEHAEVNTLFNADVSQISGEKGNFEITTKSGQTIMAAHIILAIGTQGNPNTLRCPGGDLPHIQYTLDDPNAYFDEDIIVIGGGDAGIENALGLISNPELANRVTLLQRADGFPRAKEANVKALLQAMNEGRLDVLTEAETRAVEEKFITVNTRDGDVRLPCDRIIARIGSAPPRRFVESCGVAFASEDRMAYPILSPTFESSVPGLYIVGALAGYPLIKHCMNQGYDVVEHINGNVDLKPADEPLLAEKFSNLPGDVVVSEVLEFFRQKITIFNDLTPLQMREFMLDSKTHVFKKGETVFKRNDYGSSLFSIAQGTVNVLIDPNNNNIFIPIQESEIFGEAGLISGRRRNATIKAATDCILIETPRNSARKLISTVPAVKKRINAIAIERLLSQIFGSGLSKTEFTQIIAEAELKTITANETLIQEGVNDTDIYIIRSGSMMVEKKIGDKNVFLSYVSAGSYVGEMALFEDGARTATVKAAVKSEVIQLKGQYFEDLLDANPQLKSRIMEEFADRRAMNAFIEAQKDSFDTVADLYGARANFLIDQGLGEATDALLIDETLCIGCDNCEVACAESHDGISRLNREAGQTFAHIHVPTSCRHCEHPHCMSDCPPDAIHRAPDGEVFIDDSCIGCGNCQRNCPYGVIQMETVPPKKPSLMSWVLFGFGPGPGQPSKDWTKKKLSKKNTSAPKVAIKCDMCKGINGGAACVRACPTGAAIRVSPEEYLAYSKHPSQAKS
jgi:thioredoxin reductase/CRP-like cAMP-binding protein/Fe-S-cluster-containing hydrogenase component 2